MESAVLILLLACAPPAPPAPAPVACAVTAEQVGIPGGRIEDCSPVRGVPELLQVRVDGKGHTVVLRDGQVSADRGGPALGAFLRGLPPDRAAALDLPGVIALLRAFEAFPPEFDASSAGFDLPDVGTTSFTAVPLRLVLYNGIPPEPRFVRATLTPDDAGFTWTYEARRPDGTWVITGTDRW